LLQRGKGNLGSESKGGAGKEMVLEGGPHLLSGVCDPMHSKRRGRSSEHHPAYEKEEPETRRGKSFSIGREAKGFRQMERGGCLRLGKMLAASRKGVGKRAEACPN